MKDSFMMVFMKVMANMKTKSFNLMDGPGVLKMANSDVYSGFFNKGVFSDQGTYSSSNGDFYFGLF